MLWFLVGAVFQSPLMGLLGLLVAALLYHTCVTAQHGDQACYADVSEPYINFAHQDTLLVVLNEDASEVEFPGGCSGLGGR